MQILGMQVYSARNECTFPHQLLLAYYLELTHLQGTMQYKLHIRNIDLHLRQKWSRFVSPLSTPVEPHKWLLRRKQYFHMENN